MNSSERNEDLNPGNDDIEERVKQMLDPSVPDVPDNTSEPKASTKFSETSKLEPKQASKAKAPKVITIQAQEDPVLTDEPADATPSAPVLPDFSAKNEVSNDTLAGGGKKSRKVIAVSHDTDSDEEPEDKIKDASEIKTSTDSAPLITKITIEDDDKSTADIAKALDASIAGLDATDETESDDIATKDEVDKPYSIETPGLPDPEDSSQSESIDVVDPAVITDPETDKAVEAIIVDESDELLEVEDAIRDSDEPLQRAQKERRSLGVSLKALFASKVFRWGLLLILILGLASVGAIPSARYKALNAAGVRAKSSMTVFDESTQQPLKNVQVKIGDVSATSDVNGKVQFAKVPLGATLLTVEKRAFAPVTKMIVLGWGSNPLGDFRMTPTGNQYGFTVTDFLSAKPVSKVEASSGEASALSDDNGVIKLTLDKLGDQKILVTIKGGDYRTETFELDPSTKTKQPVKLVPARKQVFVSKRSGKFDIYSVYIDGKEEKLVLAGSGAERDDMVLVPHPTANVTAYVSTRGNQHNSDGYLLSNLLLINLADNTTANIGAAERIQIVDWSGDRLVYVQIAAGTSANSPKRYQLMSYDYKDESSKELAASNYFNDVLYSNGAIYYAPSSAYQAPGTANLYKINADGSGSQTIFNKEVWNAYRTSYDHFVLSVQQEWYDYRLGGEQPIKLNSAPANQVTRVYIDSNDGKHSAWVDNRDGKGALLSYDTTSKVDATLRSQAGLTYPVHWLNNKTLVYRVKSPGETADYAISIEGGDPVKIRDVTHSGGIDRWYYY